VALEPDKHMAQKRDEERSTGLKRAGRYARVGARLTGFAARAGVRALTGSDQDGAKSAQQLKAVLGRLKGPVMKVAQMLATVPDFLPPAFAEELATLQANAPPMGPPFVRRRMSAELGPDWATKFKSFDMNAAAAASLGQVHRAVAHDGRALAVKLQYPDMQSAVAADLKQLTFALSVFRRLDRSIDTSDIGAEIGARLREELDYDRERRHMALYRRILEGEPGVHVPDALDALSTPRLLSMTWLDGNPMLSFKSAPQAMRNVIATNLFRAWWHPFARHAVIHGDPHLGNYSVRRDGSLNLLDFGCIRIFQPAFVAGVIGLYKALREDDRKAQIAAYQTWGFGELSPELIDTLNIWARFIYGPLLDDRVRSVADGVQPGDYGRAEALEVHGRLRRLGPVKPPRAFVFMDRAAIGLGSVFLHLKAELNFYQLFNEAIEGFTVKALAARQKRALAEVGLPQAED